MLNDVKLHGRLTAKPELKITKNEHKVVTFSLAVDRDGKDAGVDFITLVAWNKTAEFICQYFDKGQEMLVEASLKSRSVTNTTTNKSHTVLDVVVNRARFCGKKAGLNNEPSTAESLPDDTADYENLEPYE